MAIEISRADINRIESHLKQDQSRGYSNLVYYLKSITLNREVEFIFDDGTSLALPPNQAWNIISAWGRSAEGGLPIDDRGSNRILATRLLGYLENNIIGRAHEAAAAYYKILQQAEHPLPPSNTPTLESSNLDSLLKLRRSLIEAANARSIGLLQNQLEQSIFLKKFDPKTRALVASMLAANGDVFSQYSTHTPEQINSLLIHQAGVAEVNNVIHSAYSTDAESDPTTGRIGELEQLTNTIHKFIDDHRSDYTQDLQIIRQATLLSPNLSNLPQLVDRLIPNAPPNEKTAFIASLQTAILTSAQGQHVEGTALINTALNRAGYSAEVIPTLTTILSPYVEELEISACPQLLIGDIFDKDPRLIGTFQLAVKLGVDPSIPWVKESDLQSISEKLLPGSFDNPSLFQTAILEELNKGENADINRLSSLNQLANTHSQYRSYHSKLQSSSWLSTQEFLAKTSGNFAAIRQPYDRFVGKIWGHYENFHEFVTWPARTAFNWWDKQIEKRPWLDPVGFVYNRWTKVQKGVSLRIYKWAAHLPKGKWYSGFTRQIADFSKAFFKADANWSHASFLFFEKKMGNVLNWVANKAGHGTFAALKKSIGASIKAFASKIAPKLTAKVAAYLAEITGSVSTAGLGLVVLGLQILWDVGKFVVKKVKNFISAVWNGNADNLYGFLPLISAAIVGGAIAMLTGFPAIAVAAVTLPILFIAGLFSPFLSILIVAVFISLGLVAFSSVTFHLSNQTLPGLDVEYEPPASSAELGAATGCKDQQIPAPAGAGIPTRSSEIVADLHGGFWGYCNRPTNPVATAKYPEIFDIPDVPKIPSVYSLSNRPNLFDYELFRTVRDPTREEIQTSGNALYWCTYLVQHSYRESGKSGFSTSLWSPTLEDEFRASHTFIEGGAANSSNVKPGDIVFFKTLDGPDRTNHVGIVNDVLTQGFSYYQSNAPAINGNGTFDGSGASAESGIMVVGFGRLK